MGRSRGGLTTKIHAVVDAEGRPIKLGFVAGPGPRQHESATVTRRPRRKHDPPADRAYVTDAILAFADKHGAWAKFPPKSHRNDSFAFSKWVYRQ